MAEICAVRTIASRAEHDDVLPSADCDDDGGRGGRDRCRRSASPRAVQSCSAAAAAALEGPSAAAAADSGGGGADVDRTRSSGVVRPAATASSAATSVSELAASSLRTADTPEVHGSILFDPTRPNPIQQFSTDVFLYTELIGFPYLSDRP